MTGGLGGNGGVLLVWAVLVPEVLEMEVAGVLPAVPAHVLARVVAIGLFAGGFFLVGDVGDPVSEDRRGFSICGSFLFGLGQV